ncbi:MAG: hypothetical protein AMJ69_07540 [Gammaproteobacteria bacterium SG8_47]|nr:MAG: hypothetical protein AMJ69_07540 [Gammaproteobacteria bacterium SG8_47]
MQLLGGLSAEEFLRDHWQKRPLLVRQALPDFGSPLSPDELAGLACEDGIESRIILERDGQVPWQLENGPFEEQRFATLPQTHWTLLVQEVDQYVPALESVLEQFEFLPAWRIDDVMASYAPEYGSVGPHVDQYDVFLIQGLGHRRWQISTDPVEPHNFLPHTALRIMREFTPQSDWVLEPGDMLYLPPGVAHYGVALDDCMTFSVGFRAPSHADILVGFAEHVAAQLGDDLRYADPDLSALEHAGEIDARAAARVRTIIERYLADEGRINEWFGRYVTEPRSVEHQTRRAEAVSIEHLAQRLAANSWVQRSPHSRYAYSLTADGGCTLFVDGSSWALSSELCQVAALLANQRGWHTQHLAAYLSVPGCVGLLSELYDLGAWRFADEDD